MGRSFHQLHPQFGAHTCTPICFSVTKRIVVHAGASFFYRRLCNAPQSSSWHEATTVAPPSDRRAYLAGNWSAVMIHSSSIVRYNLITSRWVNRLALSVLAAAQTATQGQIQIAETAVNLRYGYSWLVIHYDLHVIRSVNLPLVAQWCPVSFGLMANGRVHLRPRHSLKTYTVISRAT